MNREDYMGNVEVIYGLFFKPKLGIEAAIGKRSWGLVILVVFLSCLSGMVANGLIFSQDPVFAMINLSTGLVFKFFFTFVSIFLLACVLHFIAEGLKGEGKASVLFIALGCSLLPGILISPLSLVAASIEPYPLKIAFYLIFKLTIFSWVVGLQVLAVKEVYKFSLGRAILTYLIPQVAALISFFVLFTLFILTLVMGMMAVAS